MNEYDCAVIGGRLQNRNQPRIGDGIAVHGGEERQTPKDFSLEGLLYAIESGRSKRVEHEIAEEALRISTDCRFHTSFVFRNAGNESGPADSLSIEFRHPL